MKSFHYSYCFLRYCQDTESGEFANIGVLFWCPAARFLDFRGSARYARLTHFFGDLDRDGYRHLISHVERQFQRLSRQVATDLVPAKPCLDVLSVASQVVPNDDGSLLWSAPRGGLTRDPAAELVQVYDRFIGRFCDSQEDSRRNDQDVYRQVYKPIFSAPAIADRIETHEVVAPLASHVFKHAWKNGSWNVYEPISFDLVDPDSIEKKAHTWFGRSVHLKEADEPISIHYLLGEPSIGRNRDSYRKAKEILGSCAGVRLVEEREAAAFAVDLVERITSSVLH